MGFRATHRTSGEQRFYFNPGYAEADLGRDYADEWILEMDHDPAWKLSGLEQFANGVVTFGSGPLIRRPPFGLVRTNSIHPY